MCYGYDFRIPNSIRLKNPRDPDRETVTALDGHERVQVLLEDLQLNVERMKGTGRRSFLERGPSIRLKSVNPWQETLHKEGLEEMYNEIKNDYELDSPYHLENDLKNELENDLEYGLAYDVSSEPQIEKYPELNNMKRSIINGTFDWSKTAQSILFLKKHQCFDSLLRESLRN